MSLEDDADLSAAELTRHGAHVALLTIRSRPLGVLGIAVRRGLLAHLTGLAADPGLRVVVITGTGGAFSVGADIREFRPEESWLRAAEEAETALNDFIEAMRVPVIAAINGHAYGAGLVLATACDLRVAARSARLGVPEVTLGGIASGSGTQRLARLLGRGRALSLLLTGRIVTAEEALGLGLVEEVSADERLLEDALTLARDIAAMPPLATAETKAALNTGLRHGWQAGMARELEGAVAVGLSADALEGQRAFVEKRTPRFPSEAG